MATVSAAFVAACSARASSEALDLAARSAAFSAAAAARRCPAASAAAALSAAAAGAADATDAAAGAAAFVAACSAAAAVAAAQAASAAGKPWVLDPVAVGATGFRNRLAARLLALNPTVLRGNASEILALSGEVASGKGVDAGDPVSAAEDAARYLAQRTGGVVAVSGAVDFVTNGDRAMRVAGGSPLMGRVTAMGCALTGVVGAFLVRQDPFAATVAAHACFGRAGDAELAATGAAMRGQRALRGAEVAAMRRDASAARGAASNEAEVHDKHFTLTPTHNLHPNPNPDLTSVPTLTLTLTPTLTLALTLTRWWRWNTSCCWSRRRGWPTLTPPLTPTPTLTPVPTPTPATNPNPQPQQAAGVPPQ